MTGRILPPADRAPGAIRKFWVYMLRCSDGSIYTGFTTDVGRRLATHESGRGSRYTSSRLPVRLVFVEEEESLGRALRRESQIKKLSRSSKLRLCGGQSSR